MDKNRIEGRHGAMSWHNTAKSIGMPVEVNSAAVQWSNVQLPGEISSPQGDEKSTEVIVVEEMSRGLEDARLNYETGGLTPLRSVHAVRLRMSGCATAQGHSPDEGPNQ